MLGGRLGTGRTICTRECPSAWRLQGRDALQGTSSHLLGMLVSHGGRGMTRHGRDAGPGHIKQCTGVTAAVVF